MGQHHQLISRLDNSNYKVAYNADGGTLLDENGNETTDTVRTYEYDRIYNFLKAKRAYTVSYETNGGTAAINSSNTDAPGTFNGWNEQLTEQTSHGEVQGSYDWTTGTLNWAAYYNGNPDILNAAGNVYDTIRQSCTTGHSAYRKTDSLPVFPTGCRP